jgi:hypothetical protein
MNHSWSILKPSIVPFLSNWARYTLLKSECLLACEVVKHVRLVSASNNLIFVGIISLTSLLHTEYVIITHFYPLTINIDMHYY